MGGNPKDTGMNESGPIARTSFVISALAVVGGLVALLIGALGNSRGSEGFYLWLGVSIWLLTPGACLAMLTLLFVHWPRQRSGSSGLDTALEHTGSRARR